MKQSLKDYLVKSFQFILFPLLILSWVFSQNSQLAKLNYTTVSIFKINNAGPLVIVIYAILILATIRLLISEKIKQARTEQELELIIESNRLHELEKMQLIEELKKHDELSELVYDLKEKLESSKLYDIPLISNLLIKKKILLHEQGIRLEIETSGDLKFLNQVDIKDFIFIIELSIENLKAALVDSGSYIGLHICERENNVELIIFSSASDHKPNINIEELSWNVRKLTKRYKAHVDVFYESVDNFPVIIIKFPIQIKMRKIW